MLEKYIMTSGTDFSLEEWAKIEDESDNITQRYVGWNL